jgi:hypothetical protein
VDQENLSFWGEAVLDESEDAEAFAMWGKAPTSVCRAFRNVP